MERIIDDARPDLLIFDREAVEAREYWLQRLSRERGVSTLPLDHPRPAASSGQTRIVSLDILGETYDRLLALTNQGSFLLYTTLMAVLKVCLYKYTGCSSLVVGSPARKTDQDAHRPSNLVPIIDEIDGRRPFAEFLFAVRQTLLDAYARQQYPFHRLLNDLGIAESDQRSPLFDVVLTLTDIHIEWRAEWLERKHDLILSFTRGPDRVSGRIEYQPQLFEQETIEQFGRHFSQLLGEVVKQAKTPIHALRMLTEAERRRQLEEWNESGRAYERTCIHRLFESRAESCPEAIAVIHERGSISYGELNERANRLGRYLQKRGIGPEKIVAICIEPSIEMLIGLLGVLKAGGAYLPLDAKYPGERLGYMVKDAGAEVVVTRSGMVEEWRPDGVEAICLDRDGEEISRERGGNPGSGVGPENLVYVIYTSGSTGKPKGVMVEHSGLVNMARWHADYYGVNPGDRSAQIASPGFDACGWEIWPYLSAGAAVCIAPEEYRFHPPELLKWIAAEGVTLAFFTTSLFEALLRETWPAHLSLRAALVGGDKLQREPAQALPCDLINHYGPTEGSVISTFAKIGSGPQPKPSPPIGRPIANVQTFILGADLGPAPIRTPGELYIGGDGLARGYLGRPALTAEQFIPHPFNHRFGQRLYRTGDLVRYRSEGDIDFIGRRDHQVKLRGFRIELGEIEAVLCEYPSVKEAVVIAKEDEKGEKRLIGYVAGSEGANIDRAELKRYLSERLPDYMVPAAIAVMDGFKLNANGKIDRGALPAEIEEEGDEAKEESRNAIEEVLAGIWMETLGVKRVGVKDNFFEIGGHSLLATQVISRVREVFVIEVALRRLFEEPTIAALGRLIEKELSGGHRRLPPPIARAKREGGLPLSFAQQRLWFLDLYEPANPFYNIPVAVRLSGRLDIDALHRSLLMVEQRHEALRTVFINDDGRPLQLIRPPRAALLEIRDLSSLTESLREAEAERIAAEEAAQGFDLREGPLVRYQLIKLGPAEHLMLMTMHHIISDGWSMGVLVREVAAMYEAYARGVEPELEEPEIQYADYAVWQREWLRGEVLEEELSYWQRQLEGAPAVLELPTDRPRPAAQSYRGASEAIELGAETSERLRTLSRREGATMFMSLLAAFDVLLYRYSGQDDLVVGTPIANRHRREIEGLIGFFVNTLAMRTEVRGSYREVLRRVRETALGAYAHQDLPFEMLVEKLQPERSLSYSPLFQVMFVLQNAPGATVDLQELKLEFKEGETHSSEFDLTMVLAETEESIAGAIEYNTDLFDAETIRRMIRHFRRLIDSITREPEQQADRLQLMSETEEREIIEVWNETAAEYEREAGIIELFEREVEERRDAVAVEHGAERVSYGELNRRGNRLGRYLRSKGVGAEEVVGICLERGIEMMVGLIGILKAGGAYLPLDPTYPKQQFQFMLENAQARILLTESRLMEVLPENDAQIICLDLNWNEIAREPGEDLNFPHAPESLAYLIYTSGSTGWPKGVMVRHGSLANYVRAARVEYAMGSGDRVLQLTSICFDYSADEIYPCLASGATLVLRTESTLASAPTFLRQCRDWAITVAMPPTAFLHELIGALEATGRQLPPAMRLAATGGETILPDRLAQWRRKVGQSVPLINTYGPTEATIVSTMCDLSRTPDEKIARRHLPIGRPVKNVQTYVLDERLGPALIGVSGELHIAGAGLARGYFNRPDLTAEGFIPNPYSKAPGARMYRSGDLACYQSDGELEFIGRIDQQVKVRGFRIETGGIETVLNRHPGVRESAVVPHENHPGDIRLAAYLVPEAGREIDLESLRAALKASLPDYMTPVVFTILERLPKTANDKIDRRRLPRPDQVRAQLDRDYLAPRDALELKLAEIWEELLNVRPIGVRENFFELGGHSLLAVRLMARIEGLKGRSIPLATLFQAPTIESQAGWLRQAAPSLEQFPLAPLAPLAPLVCLQPGNGSRPLFFVHPVGGNVFCYLNLAHRLGPDRPVYGLQNRLGDDHRPADRRIEEMAAAYVEAMRGVQPEGPYLLGGWSMGGVVAFDMARRLTAAGQEVALLALIDSYAPTLWGETGKQNDQDLLFDFAADLGIPLNGLDGLDGLDGPLDGLISSTNHLSSLAADEQLAQLLKAAKNAHLLPPDIDVAYARRLFEVFRNNARAMTQYVPQAIPVRATLLRAVAGAPAGADDSGGWGDFAAHGIVTDDVPGDHYSLLREPHVEVLARKLMAYL